MSTAEIKLPSHEDCADKMEQGIATALDIFIHENEPAGDADSEKFRSELANMLLEYATLRAKEIAANAFTAGESFVAHMMDNDLTRTCPPNKEQYLLTIK